MLAFGSVEHIRKRLRFTVMAVVQAEVEPDLRGRVANPARQHGHLDEYRQHPGLARAFDELANTLDYGRVHRQVDAVTAEVAVWTAEVTLHVDDQQGGVRGVDELGQLGEDLLAVNLDHGISVSGSSASADRLGTRASAKSISSVARVAPSAASLSGAFRFR